jgi:anti-anti-sigma factor
MMAERRRFLRGFMSAEQGGSQTSPPIASLTVTVQPDTTLTRVRVAGELDMATEPILLDAVERIRNAGPNQVVAELSELSFCDVRGLAALLAVHDRLSDAGLRVSMTGASAQVRWMVGITGLEQHLDLSADEDAKVRTSG